MNGLPLGTSAASASVKRWRWTSLHNAVNLRGLCHWLVLIVGLCGPAIGAFGIYGGNLLIIAVLPILVLRYKEFTLRQELLFMLLLGLCLAIYVLSWATFAGGASWGYGHLAIIVLSGGAFLINALLACYRGSACRVLAWLNNFMWVVLILALIESATGARVPVSRYSTLAPSLGFAYEGHDGASPLIDGAWVPTGFFGNQNNLAFAILCLLPFALVSQRTLCSRILLASASGLVIFLSESRIALLVGFVWLTLAICRRLLRYAAPIAMTVFIKLGVWLWLASQSFIDAICVDNSQKLCFAIGLLRELSLSDLQVGQDSISVRVQLTTQTFLLWIESPFIGVGPGHLGSLISALHSEGVVITDAHNAPLQVLAEYGLLGASFWFVGFVIIALAVMRMPNDEAGSARFKSASKTFLLLLPFASVTVSTVYYFVPVWVLAGTMLGVALGARSDKVRSYD